MTEHVREEQLALYAGGDLPPCENSAVAAHVRGCHACQQALAEFHNTQSFLLASLQNSETGELLEVRGRLMEKLSSRRIGQRRWAPWVVGAAAALALFFLPRGVEHKTATVQMGRTMVAPLPPIKKKTVSRTVAEAPHLLRAAYRKKRLRPREAGIRTVSLIAQADQTPTIKMTTADPNVVIIWQTNERTGQEP